MDLELLQKQILCADIDEEYMVRKYSWDTILKAIKSIKKDDFLDEYGTEGFDIVYDMKMKEYQRLHNHLEEHPEKWI